MILVIVKHRLIMLVMVVDHAYHSAPGCLGYQALVRHTISVQGSLPSPLQSQTARVRTQALPPRSYLDLLVHLLGEEVDLAFGGCAGLKGFRKLEKINLNFQNTSIFLSIFLVRKSISRLEGALALRASENSKK
jgi:hypothetical protein